MRFSKSAYFLVLNTFAFFAFVGCAPFQGPPDLTTLGPYVPAQGSKQEVSSDEEDEEEVLHKYIPSARGDSKGYKPKKPFKITWPLNYVKINQHFNPNKKRRPHLGVDFGGVKGAPIFASHEGLVIYAGKAFKGYGRLVIVEYDDQWATLYAHLDKINVKTGQIVDMGQTLGTMGRTGRATGVHLHYELLHHQKPINPIPLLNEVQRLVDLQ